MSRSPNTPGSPSTGDKLSPTKLLHGQWLWPESDTRAAEFVFKRLPDLYKALEHVWRFGICVQAGGNCGVWPKHLATVFETVYTFEADPLNFRCLCANVPEENVFKIPMALCADMAPVEMIRSDNIGAHYVEGKGSIPTQRIDNMCLRGLDFLQLDIEGHEHEVLLGADETIGEYSPVIMIEDKDYKRGIERGATVETSSSQCSQLLRSWNYDIAFWSNSDFLYTYRGA